jgi:hypothetical protein
MAPIRKAPHTDPLAADSETRPEIEDWVPIEKRLSRDARKALNTLVEANCDQKLILNLLTFLADAPQRLRLSKPEGWETSRPVSLSPLDDLPGALRGVSGKAEKIDIRALQRTARRARKLLKEIEYLKRTPLVIWLRENNYLDPEDLLAGSLVPGLTASRFRGLLELPRLAKRAGARPRPDFTRRLNALYKHIHERTGQWHDLELSRLLYDLFPQPLTPLALEKWRGRHGLCN